MLAKFAYFYHKSVKELKKRVGISMKC